MKHYNPFRFIACVMAVTTLFVACRKEPLELQNPNTRRCSTYFEQFEAVWEGIDHTYVLWSRDTVDWDARYEKFKPIFESFDARGTVDVEEWSQAWEDFTYGLLDHHMYIRLYNPKSEVTLGLNPAKNDYEHKTDISAQIAILKQQPGVTNYVEYWDSKNPYTNSVACLLPGKTTGKYIAYLRLGEFAISTLYKDDTLANKAAIEAPLRAFYGDDYSNGISNGLAAREDVESIIIDLRGNPGGNVADLSPAIGSLMQTGCEYGYSRYKQGTGRLDYSGWMPAGIPLPLHHLTKANPVVALTDINSVSCAELSTQIIKTMPQGKVIGERTYGGTCALNPYTDVWFNIYYTGCFGDQKLFPQPGVGDGKPTHPEDFAYYVYSGTFDIVTKDYKSLEGVGVQPDIKVLYDAEALAAGRDTQLDAALSYLCSNQ